MGIVHWWRKHPTSDLANWWDKNASQDPARVIRDKVESDQRAQVDQLLSDFVGAHPHLWVIASAMASVSCTGQLARIRARRSSAGRVKSGPTRRTAGVDVELPLQIATANVSSGQVSGPRLKARSPPQAVFGRKPFAKCGATVDEDGHYSFAVAL